MSFDEEQDHYMSKADFAMMCDEIKSLNATIAKRDELIAKKNAELAVWDCIIDDMQVAVSCINPREDMRRAIEALKATIAQLQEENKNKELVNLMHVKLNRSLQAELTASQEQVKMLRDFIVDAGICWSAGDSYPMTLFNKMLAATAPAVSPTYKE
jgi:hypothetical protein